MIREKDFVAEGRPAPEATSGGGLKILVWCPVLSPGGGSRLLAQLVRQWAVLPGVSGVRVVTNSETVRTLKRDLSDRPTVEYMALNPKRFLATFAWRAWLHADSPMRRLLTSRVRNAVADALARLAYRREAWWARRAAAGMDVCYAFWPHMIDPIPVDGVPVVSTFQDATLLHYPELGGLVHAILEWERMKKWAERSDAIVVSSRATDADYRAYLGECWKPTTLIPHRILPDHRDGGGQLPPGVPERFVVYPANTSPHKNHANLLAAWARIPPAERLPLVFFGHGTDAFHQATHPPYTAASPATPSGPVDHGFRLAAIARRLGLTSGRDLFAFGYLPDDQVLALSRRATALVMPSLNEGGGSYPVEEALSLGVPVLCSDIPVMREHLAERSAKIAWFDPNSLDSIGLAYRDLMVRYDEYKASAVAGMSDSRPTWESIAARYIEVFKSVTRSKVPQRGTG